MTRNTVAVIALALGTLLGGIGGPIKARAAQPYVPYVPEDKKLAPEDFKCFFSAAQGWGSFEQKVVGNVQQAVLEVKWGQLKLKEIALTLAGSTTPQAVTIKLGGRTLVSRLQIKEGRAHIVLQDECVIPAGAKLDIQLGT